VSRASAAAALLCCPVPAICHFSGQKIRFPALPSTRIGLKAPHLALHDSQQGFDPEAETEGYFHIGGWISYPSSVGACPLHLGCIDAAVPKRDVARGLVHAAIPRPPFANPVHLRLTIAVGQQAARKVRGKGTVPAYQRRAKGSARRQVHLATPTPCAVRRPRGPDGGTALNLCAASLCATSRRRLLWHRWRDDVQVALRKGDLNSRLAEGGIDGEV